MPINDSSAIDAVHVSVTYNDLAILDDISFSIKQGEYIALIGPNGAGKTTLLKVILGLITPSSGNVKLFGQNNATFKQRYLLGYIPQRVSTTLFKFPATVEEIIRSGRTAKLGLLHSWTSQDKKAVEWAIEVANVGNHLFKPIGQLSGGELQRVFIARALAGEPKILLLDEPTVGVDLATQEKFYAFLQEINKKFGITILIVTHEVDVAVHRAQFVLCLNRKLICHIKSHLLLKGNYLEQLYGSHVHLVRHSHYNET